ncbi:MAG: PTS sugar transporter subunit IIA [Sporolactobacillus sp.]
MEEILSEKLINLKLKAVNRYQACDELAHMLYDEHFISNVEQFIKSVLDRETYGNTEIGNATVIPHGISDTVIKSTMAIGKSDTGILWEENSEPIRLIILLAVRDDDEQLERNTTIASVMKMLADNKKIDLILHSSNKKTIIQYLKQ